MGAVQAVNPCVFIGPLDNEHYCYCSELCPYQQLQLDIGFESVQFSPAVKLYVVTIALPLRCETFTHKLTMEITSKIKTLELMLRQGQKHTDSMEAYSIGRCTQFFARFPLFLKFF